MFRRTAILMLIGVACLSAKSYTFTLSSPAQAGTVQLKRGEYKLKVDGSQVVLTDQTGHRIETTAAVEDADQKYPQTTLTMSNEDGGPRIVSIELANTTRKVVFQ